MNNCDNLQLICHAIYLGNFPRCMAIYLKINSCLKQIDCVSIFLALLLGDETVSEFVHLLAWWPRGEDVDIEHLVQYVPEAVAGFGQTYSHFLVL